MQPDNSSFTRSPLHTDFTAISSPSNDELRSVDDLRIENQELSIKIIYLEKQLKECLAAQANLLDKTDKPLTEEEENLLSQLVALKGEIANVQEEREQLLWSFNRLLPRSLELEKENEVLKRKQERNIPPHLIVSYLSKNEHCVSLFECRKKEEKMQLLRAAAETLNPDVVLIIILYLKETMNPNDLLCELERNRVVELYAWHMWKTEDFDGLVQLFKFAKKPADVAFFMVQRAFSAKETSNRLLEIRKCVSFFEKIESLHFYSKPLTLYQEKLQQSIYASRNKRNLQPSASAAAVTNNKAASPGPANKSRASVFNLSLGGLLGDSAPEPPRAKTPTPSRGTNTTTTTTTTTTTSTPTPQSGSDYTQILNIKIKW